MLHFGDINAGTKFLIRDSNHEKLFMKIWKPGNTQPIVYNAVDLSSGELRTFKNKLSIIFIPL